MNKQLKKSLNTENCPHITIEQWGNVNAQDVFLYTLINSSGMEVQLTNYGCTIVSWKVPDNHGKFENIVLGLSDLDAYLSGHPCFGNIVGRFANRIGDAKFTLDGVVYPLSANCGKNHIHGGNHHFGTKVWKVLRTDTNSDSATLSLSYVSRDMEEGYPGNLIVNLDYTLDNEGCLSLNYTAATDKSTVLNLTNHAYFNLTGCKENVLNHRVRIYSDSYLPVNIPVDHENIPSGVIRSVEGTPFDLRQWTTIKDRMQALPRGFDNNYCLHSQEKTLLLASELFDPQSGRLLQTYTTEPAVV
ncbi:MAG: galactose mutarotase, partial [Dysgonamonadaceae bacterium]|nr:galactose mutarotase [Dysgonamonadaceae bacterium]